MKVIELDNRTWTSASWQPEMDTAVEAYLRHSREEITLREEWIALGEAMLLRADLRLWVVTTDDNHFAAFALARLLPGTLATGAICQVWQVYVDPKRGKFTELFPLVWPEIVRWAEQSGIKRFTFMTRRITVGYDRLMRSVGFKPYAIMYTT